MKLKKIVSIVAAMALVCAVSVAGTLAYLTATTEKVTNTFTAAGLIEDPENNFILDESKAVPNPNVPGAYTLETGTRVKANDYELVPAVPVLKDPMVTIKGGALGTSAYLFIEVVDTTPDTVTFTIDPLWTALTGVTGANGGQIYAAAVVNPSDEDQTWNILEGTKVEVASNFEAPAAGITMTLEFYAYLSQAGGFDGPAAAWAATFGDTGSQNP